ncbi:hypothetical protein BKI52_14590 [marine bacterium AO1-C]|nr:hypothetical protein BKI52_14590 [marine bacterium AO1-C]
MFKNYLKISIRNLLRNKIYSLINILGLAVGITCFILLYLYTSRELSYDQYQTHKDEVYRIVGDMSFGDWKQKVSSFSSQLGNKLHDDLPEVTHAAIINQEKSAIKLGQKEIKKPRLFYANQDLFQVLDFKAIAGNLDQSLTKPKTIVLTRSLAQKFFNAPRKALGKVLMVHDSVPFMVTAVIEDVPANSHFKPGALISASTIEKANPKFFKDWTAWTFTTYLRIKPEASINEIAAYAKNLHEEKVKSVKIDFTLESLTDIYLSSTLKNGYADTGDAHMVYTLLVVGLLILLIASINYMNLATARSVERAKEVGIRKVVGSTRRQLIAQFLVESVFICLFAFVISLSLVELLLPKFNQLTGGSYQVGYNTTPLVVISLLGVVLLVGLLSGSFPALVLSRFSPHLVLKGKFSHSQKGNRFRKALVVVQFSISLVMIVSTLVVREQMHYARSKSLGFDQEQLLTVPVYARQKVLKQQLLLNPNISQVAFGMPLNAFGGTEFKIEQENGEVRPMKANIKEISNDWLQTLKVKKIAGRYFRPGLTAGFDKSVIVNEAFVKKMSWKNPIGKKIIHLNAQKKNVTARVVGVVQDFHSEALYKEISPMIFTQNADDYWAHQQTYIRIKPKNLQKTLAFIQQTYQTLYPKQEYQGKFVDQQFAEAYRADQKRAEVFALFSGIAIFIACIGLFGLASFTVSQRSKEIGIRKVLGASITQILSLLSGGFVRLIVLSGFIAFPIAYYLMSQWLQNFAYRTTIHWSLFVLAGGVTLLITLLMVSVQSLRTAQVNPVKVLKDE